MSPARFLALPLAHASRAVPFNQRAFRRRYLPADATPLCSALVTGWLRAAKTRADYLAALRAPTPELLRHLVESQRTHAYPMLTGAALNAADREMIRDRYGLRDAEAPDTLLERLRAPDFAAYELRQNLGMRTSTQSSFPGADEAFFAALLTGPPHGLVLKALSIRHAVTAADGRITHKSHRIGIALRDRAWSLFDPIAGCVEFQAAKRAAAWLRAFWAASPYPARRSCAGVPLLTLYSMT